jgi:hypothetical protein
MSCHAIQAIHALLIGYEFIHVEVMVHCLLIAQHV